MKNRAYCFILFCFFSLYSVKSYSQVWKDDSEKAISYLNNPEHANCLKCKLKDSAIYFLNKKDNENSIKYLEKIKEIGIDDSDWFTPSNLGILYSLNGKFKKVEFLLTNAQSKIERQFGKDNLTYVNNLFYLGNYYSIYKGDNIKAENLYKIAIAIRDKNNIIDPQYFMLKAFLADIYRKSNRLDSAKIIYTELIALSANSKFSINSNTAILYSIALQGMADIYKNTGKTDSAIQFYEKEIAVIRGIYEIYDKVYIRAIGKLGQLYSESGDYFNAEKKILECANILKMNYGEYDKEYLSNQSMLASLYLSTGQQNKAKNILTKTLERQKTILETDNENNELVEDYLITIEVLGGYYFEMKDYYKALAIELEDLNFAKKVYGQYSDKYRNALRQLILIYDLLGNYKDAEYFCQEIIKISMELKGENTMEYANDMQQLADIYTNLGKYIESEELLTNSLNIIEKNTGKTHEYANVLEDLSVLYQKNGKQLESEKLMLESLSINEKVYGKKSYYYFHTLQNLSLRFCTNNYENGAKYILQKNEWIINNIKEHFFDLSANNKIDFFNKCDIEFNDFRDYFSVNNKYSKDIQQLVGVCYNNELLSKGIILRNFLKIRNSILNGSDTSLINQFNTLISINKKLEKSYSIPQTNTELVQSLENKRDKLETSISKNSKLFSDSKKIFDLDWNGIKQFLKKNDAVIEYYKVDNDNFDTCVSDYSALLLTSKTNVPKQVYLFEENSIINTILNIKPNEFGKESHDIYNYAYYKNLSYDFFWKKFDSALSGIKNIYIALTGSLNNLNLSAIPIDSTTTFGEKYNIHILGTTADVINYKPTYLSTKSIQTAIVYGGIDYDKANNISVKSDENKDPIGFEQVAELASRSGGAVSKFGYLKGTEEETKNIQDLCSSNRIKAITITGKNATELSFKQLSGKKEPFILHIATHGYFFPEPEKKKHNEPMQQLMEPEKKNVFKWSDEPLLRSGLIFAGANKAWGNPDYVSNDSTEDGILTSYEISNLDLSNCQLVVLSACETGLGDIKGSEGVFGLQRAFKMAGVKNIIMSLWKVPDAQTSELMTLFYNYCFAGKSVHDALQVAQTDMRKKGYAPYYWAAFKLLE